MPAPLLGGVGGGSVHGKGAAGSQTFLHTFWRETNPGPPGGRGKLLLGSLLGTRRFTFQTDRLSDVIEFFTADLVEFLAFGLELFVDLDGLFRHLFVSFLAAPDQGEVRAGGNAFMAVRVQTHAEHD